MLTPVVQRWREHRAHYRPARETIRVSEYEVAPIPYRTAKDFVEVVQDNVKRSGAGKDAGHPAIVVS